MHEITVQKLFPFVYPKILKTGNRAPRAEIRVFGFPGLRTATEKHGEEARAAPGAGFEDFRGFPAPKKQKIFRKNVEKSPLQKNYFLTVSPEIFFNRFVLNKISR